MYGKQKCLYDFLTICYRMKLYEAQDYLQSLIEDESDQEYIAGVYIQPPDATYDSAKDDADRTMVAVFSIYTTINCIKSLKLNL